MRQILRACDITLLRHITTYKFIMILIITLKIINIC